MRICLASTPTLPSVALTATVQSQTAIALQAGYPGIPFAATLNFESSASASGPFTQIAAATPVQVLSGAGTSGTFTDNSLTASTTRFYRARAQFRQPQQAGLFTQYSPIVSATTLPAVISTRAKPLHPGNGFWFDNQYWPGNQQTLYNSVINGLLADPTIAQIQIVLTWGAMEGPTRGDYSNGFAILDGILAKLRTAGHHVGLAFQQWQSFFNTQNTTSTANWPQYVVNKGNWVKAFTGIDGKVRVQFNYDIDDLWAAQTAMFQAYGDRYDSDPNFEMVSVADESDAVSLNSAGQTILDSTHYNSKYKQMHLDIKANWPTTLNWVPFNYLPPGGAQEVTAMCDMIQTFRAAYPGGFVFGGPDPAIRGCHGQSATNWLTTFQQIITGNGVGTTGNLRNVMALLSNVQEFLLGNIGNPPNQPTDTVGQPVTPTRLMSEAVDVYKAQYVFWNYQTWEFYKASDQLAVIHARNGVTNPVPSNYL